MQVAQIETQHRATQLNTRAGATLTAMSKANASALQVQIFGFKKSASTRAAERFFKERRVKIHFVDLKQRPMSKGELTRFVQKFGLNALLDTESKAYENSNLAYLHVTDDQLLEKIIEQPELLRVPLVRGGKVLALGEDKANWTLMLQS